MRTDVVVYAIFSLSVVGAGCGDIQLPPGYGVDAGDASTVDGGVDADSSDATGGDARPGDAMATDATTDGGIADAAADVNAADVNAADVNAADVNAADVLDAGAPVVHWVLGATVTTLAGGADAGATNGNGSAAQFDNPVTLERDALGNLLVTEYDGSRLRKVSPSGDVTTVTSQGDVVGPFAIEVMPDGTVVMQTDYNPNGVKNDTSGTLWKVEPGGFAVVLRTGLALPRGLGALSPTKLAVAERSAHVVGIYDLGTMQLSALAGVRGGAGYADGVGAQALFNEPYGVAVFSDGTVLVADSKNNRLRAVRQDGTVTTFAGNGVPGMVDGPRLACAMNAPRDVAIDAQGNVFFSDFGNHRIRRIDAATGEVQTVAGTGVAGFGDGAGDGAQFFGQEGLDVAPNGKTVFLADGTDGNAGLPYNRVRVITLP